LTEAGQEERQAPSGIDRTCGLKNLIRRDQGCAAPLRYFHPHLLIAHSRSIAGAIINQLDCGSASAASGECQLTAMQFAAQPAGEARSLSQDLLSAGGNADD
jgi:hypothetical protein